MHLYRNSHIICLKYCLFFKKSLSFFLIFFCVCDSFSFQCMGYTAEMERDFIKEDLGPMLSLRGHTDVKIIMLDDSRLFLPSWVDTILSDPGAAEYVAGIGVHWYEDKYMPAKVLTDAHNR